MRKVYSLIAILVLFSLTFVLAVDTILMYPDVDSALNFLRQHKIGRDESVSSALSSIKYTTEKECIINYETEYITCNACVSYLVNDTLENECFMLPYNSSLAYDNALIRSLVKEIVDWELSVKIGFIEREISGQEIM